MICLFFFILFGDAWILWLWQAMTRTEEKEDLPPRQSPLTFTLLGDFSHQVVPS